MNQQLLLSFSFGLNAFYYVPQSRNARKVFAYKFRAIIRKTCKTANRLHVHKLIMLYGNAAHGRHRTKNGINYENQLGICHGRSRNIFSTNMCFMNEDRNYSECCKINLNGMNFEIYQRFQFIRSERTAFRYRKLFLEELKQDKLNAQSSL